MAWTMVFIDDTSKIPQKQYILSAKVHIHEMLQPPHERRIFQNVHFPWFVFRMRWIHCAEHFDISFREIHKKSILDCFHLFIEHHPEDLSFNFDQRPIFLLDLLDKIQ